MFNDVFGIFERSWPNNNSIHSISSLQNSPVALHPNLPRHPEKTSLHRINNFFGVSPNSISITAFSPRWGLQGTCDDQAVPVCLSAAITTSGHWFPIIAALGLSWRPWRHRSGSWALGTLGLVTSCWRQILRRDKLCTSTNPPKFESYNKLRAEVESLLDSSFTNHLSFWCVQEESC